MYSLNVPFKVASPGVFLITVVAGEAFISMRCLKVPVEAALVVEDLATVMADKHFTSMYSIKVLSDLPC